MNALGEGNGSMALKEAQLVLFPSHTGYLTLVLFAHPPTPFTETCPPGVHIYQPCRLLLEGARSI